MKNYIYCLETRVKTHNQLLHVILIIYRLSIECEYCYKSEDKKKPSIPFEELRLTLFNVESFETSQIVFFTFYIFTSHLRKNSSTFDFKEPQSIVNRNKKKPYMMQKI